MKKENTNDKEAVIVTTAHRGVFFGYTSDIDGSSIDLERARLCVYWSSDMHGFMGLASMGPSDTCRIGPAANIQVRDVTAVLRDLPAAAIARWESAPWG